jgi:hypothetical protein
MADAATPRRPGRPKGSTKAARNEREAAAPPPAAPVALEPAAPVAPPPAAGDSGDVMLSQIARLWPSLHPHARRALVMYASALWAEGGYEG